MESIIKQEGQRCIDRHFGERNVALIDRSYIGVIGDLHKGCYFPLEGCGVTVEFKFKLFVSDTVSNIPCFNSTPNIPVNKFQQLFEIKL